MSDLLGACVEKDCEKPRFLDYYVCAEHFAAYAAPRYTESMLVKTGAEPVAPAIYPDFSSYPEESPCDGGWQETPPPDPTQSEAIKRAPIF